VTAAADLLRERLDQVRVDLIELDGQIADGDIDPAAADRLRAVYEAEIARIEARLDGLDGGSEAAPVGEPVAVLDEKDARSGLKPATLILALALMLAVAISAMWPAGRQPGATAEAAATAAPATDLAAMTTEELEALVARSPDLPAAQLALADRYLGAGDGGAALDHYLAVADSRSAAPAQRSQALARVGYLAYKAGRYGPAREYLTQSLALDGSNSEAKLYLGYVLFDGFDDPKDAAPYLEGVLADPALPATIAADVRAKLAEVPGG